MAGLSLRRALLRTFLSLPSPVLRAFAGGGGVYRGGRTLDSRFQFLAALDRRTNGAERAVPEAFRRAHAETLPMVSGRPEPDVEAQDIVLPGPHRPLPARVYRPKDQDPAMPIMVFAHFGGGVIGGLETCHVFCTVLARIVRCPVLSVDYALAPEHRFPAGLEDVLAAYRWARDNAHRFEAPAGVAAIGGDSMGGNFAAVAAQELRRAGEPQPALQLLIYPCVDLASQTPSMTTYADAFPLSRALMEWFAGHYAGADASPADPRLSPLRQPDLSGLAPAVVATAGFDPLLDQGELYARALRAAGTPVAYRCYDSLAHSFTAFTGAVPAADAACREIAGLARASLAGAVA